MKKGFVLIELLISLLIVSIISISLMTAIFQISQMQDRVNTITSMYNRIASLQNVMEQDIMGAFIPTQVEIIAVQKETAEKVQPLEKIFESTNKDNQLEMLTFITNNPREIYLLAKNVEPKAKVARVVYRIEPEPKRKNSFILTRQEGQVLPLSKYPKDAKNELRAFPVINGISEFSITYLKPESKKEDGNTKKFTRVKEWKSTQKSKDGLRSISLPHYAEVNLSLWDNTYTKKKKFIFTIPIAGELSWQEKKKSPLVVPTAANKNVPSGKDQKQEVAFAIGMDEKEKQLGTDSRPTLSDLAKKLRGAIKV